MACVLGHLVMHEVHHIWPDGGTENRRQGHPDLGGCARLVHAHKGAAARGGLWRELEQLVPWLALWVGKPLPYTFYLIGFEYILIRRNK